MAVRSRKHEKLKTLLTNYCELLDEFNQISLEGLDSRWNALVPVSRGVAMQMLIDERRDVIRHLKTLMTNSEDI